MCQGFTVLSYSGTSLHLHNRARDPRSGIDLLRFIWCFQESMFHPPPDTHTHTPHPHCLSKGIWVFRTAKQRLKSLPWTFILGLPGLVPSNSIPSCCLIVFIPCFVVLMFLFKLDVTHWPHSLSRQSSRHEIINKKINFYDILSDFLFDTYKNHKWLEAYLILYLFFIVTFQAKNKWTHQQSSKKWEWDTFIEFL